MMSGISELDIPIVQKIQALGEWLLPVMKFFAARGCISVHNAALVFPRSSYISRFTKAFQIPSIASVTPRGIR